jgi:hypothetical protein
MALAHKSVDVRFSQLEPEDLQLRDSEAAQPLLCCAELLKLPVGSAVVLCCL